jgi:hypothetical protein
MEKIANDELQKFNSSLDVIGVTKLRRSRWKEHVESMGKREMHTKYW